MSEYPSNPRFFAPYGVSAAAKVMHAADQQMVDKQRYVDAVTQLKNAINELRRLHFRSVSTGSCDHCSPQARAWPCTTIATLERNGC